MKTMIMIWSIESSRWLTFERRRVLGTLESARSYYWNILPSRYS